MQGGVGFGFRLAPDELGCSLVLPTPRMAVLQTTLSNRAFIFFWLIRPPAKARKACFSASRGGLLAVRSGLVERGLAACKTLGIPSKQPKFSGRILVHPTALG